MKKFLFIVAVALTSVGYAQTDKGDWMVGSDLALSYESAKTTTKYDGDKRGDTTISTFKVTPNLNYFIVDNLALGLGLSYSNRKIKGQDGSKDSFTVVPNVHYYFPLDTNLKPFIGAGVGYKIRYDGKEDVDKWNGLTVGGKLGIAYFVNNGAALTGYVGYDFDNLKNKKDDKLKLQTGTLGVGIGVALFF